MKIVCGFLGAITALLAVAAIPPPNLQLTSYATSYDIWTGHPHLAWRGWVWIFSLIVGFIVGKTLYSHHES